MVSDHRSAIGELGELDPVTQDVLVNQSAKLEQYQWFVRAHLEDPTGALSTRGATTLADAAKQASGRAPGKAAKKATKKAAKKRTAKKARKATKKRAKKASPAKKASSAEKASPAKKAAPAKKASPAKKAAKKVAKAAKAAGSTAVAWVAPDDGVCPPSHPIKAKLSSKIFHLPGMFAYARTVPDRCYGTAEAAEADGLVKAKR